MSIQTEMPLLPSRALALDEFIEYTGWSPVLSRRGMETALRFYQAVVPHQVLRKLDYDPSPWALPAGQPTLCLTQFMQAIDFRSTVEIVTLSTDVLYKRFVLRRNGRRGAWYTKIESQAEEMAIPYNQTAEIFYRVRGDVKALESRIADAYVDWTRKAKSNSALPEYRHGSTTQFFVWNSKQFLHPVTQSR